MTEHRAYARIEIKSIDDEERVIEGIASTPSTDRMDDIVESLGARFQLPMPFLYQHNSRAPVGNVTWAQPTKDGIPFRAKIARTFTAGAVKDRLDQAWEEIKLGLVRAVSIGFKPLEWEPIDAKDPFGGRRFKAWEWLELSMVTIPANADATINTIRSYDQAARAAATGIAQPFSVDRNLPAATGHLRNLPATGLPKPTAVRAQEGKMKKTIAEQISAFENTRAAKQARMDALMDDAADKGETLAPDAKEEYATLKQEVKEIDDHLVLLRDREQSNRQALVPVSAQPR